MGLDPKLLSRHVLEDISSVRAGKDAGKAGKEDAEHNLTCWLLLGNGGRDAYSRVLGFGFSVKGLGFRLDQGLGFKVQGLG